MTVGAAARRDIAADITKKIIQELERGAMPWRKPWDSTRVGVALPRRVTGDGYRGINVLVLWQASLAGGYRSPFWLTFKQAVAHGAAVCREERGAPVVYYGHGTRPGAAHTGEPEESFRFLKSYTVFNAEQIEGLPDCFYPHPIITEPMPLAAHEAWFAKLDIARMRTRDIACYIPSKDAIGMPPLAAFDSAEDYAATLNHEAVHATAAPHRVGRDLARRFASRAYAAEELVAEIGSAFLGAHLGLPPAHLNDHAAYIGHWLEMLSEDKRALLTAAAQAQTAVDWLLAKSPAPAERQQ